MGKGRVVACCSVVESKGNYCFSKLAISVCPQNNVRHQFCWTERVAHDPTVNPLRAGSVWLETSLSLSVLLHLQTGWSGQPAVLSTLSYHECYLLAQYSFCSSKKVLLEVDAEKKIDYWLWPLWSSKEWNNNNTGITE